MFSWVGLQMKLSFILCLDANMIKWCTGPGSNRVKIKSSLNIVDIHDTKNEKWEILNRFLCPAEESHDPVLKLDTFRLGTT